MAELSRFGTGYRIQSPAATSTRARARARARIRASTSTRAKTTVRLTWWPQTAFCLAVTGQRCAATPARPTPGCGCTFHSWCPRARTRGSWSVSAQGTDSARRARVRCLTPAHDAGAGWRRGATMGARALPRVRSGVAAQRIQTEHASALGTRGVPCLPYCNRPSLSFLCPSRFDDAFVHEAWYNHTSSAAQDRLVLIVSLWAQNGKQQQLPRLHQVDVSRLFHAWRLQHSHRTLFVLFSSATNVGGLVAPRARHVAKAVRLRAPRGAARAPRSHGAGARRAARYERDGRRGGAPSRGVSGKPDAAFVLTLVAMRLGCPLQFRRDFQWICSVEKKECSINHGRISTGNSST